MCDLPIRRAGDRPNAVRAVDPDTRKVVMIVADQEAMRRAVVEAMSKGRRRRLRRGDR